MSAIVLPICLLCFFKGLVAAGEDVKTSKALAKARSFLLSVQNENGSWGEDFKSCVEYRYVNLPEVSDVKSSMSFFTHSCFFQGQVVNTAWAVLSLICGGAANHPKEMAAVERG